MLHPDLFEPSSALNVRFERLGNKIPVLLIDDFYADPDAVRESALKLTYSSPPYPYPGKLAVVEEPNRSLLSVTQKILDLVNREYLPRVPIAKEGRRLSAFPRVYTDFAVVDVHPDELSEVQRRPHVDPVPVFGLIYLNREVRGGTLFFEPTPEVAKTSDGGGYLTTGTSEFHLCARIEGSFNRLAIYPGFVPHSGEIAGDWIRSEERFKSPRLTQRLVFPA